MCCTCWLYLHFLLGSLCWVRQIEFDRVLAGEGEQRDEHLVIIKLIGPGIARTWGCVCISQHCHSELLLVGLFVLAIPRCDGLHSLQHPPGHLVRGLLVGVDTSDEILDVWGLDGVGGLTKRNTNCEKSMGDAVLWLSTIVIIYVWKGSARR